MQALALPAHADAPTPIPMQQLMELARGGAAALPADARIEIEPGQLDPRLKLTPCRRIEPYLPTGSTAWGRTRVGLRCTDGPVNWNVFLPVTVRVWSPAVVNAGPLQAGAEIRAEDLQIREVDIASFAAAQARIRSCWSDGCSPPRCRPAPRCARITCACASGSLPARRSRWSMWAKASRPAPRPRPCRTAWTDRRSGCAPLPARS